MRTYEIADTTLVVHAESEYEAITAAKKFVWNASTEEVTIFSRVSKDNLPAVIDRTEGFPEFRRMLNDINNSLASVVILDSLTASRLDRNEWATLAEMAQANNTRIEIAPIADDVIRS